MHCFILILLPSANFSEFIQIKHKFGQQYQLLQLLGISVNPCKPASRFCYIKLILNAQYKIYVHFLLYSVIQNNYIINNPFIKSSSICNLVLFHLKLVQISTIYAKARSMSNSFYTNKIDRLTFQEQSILVSQLILQQQELFQETELLFWVHIPPSHLLYQKRERQIETKHLDQQLYKSSTEVEIDYKFHNHCFIPRLTADMTQLISY